VKPIRIFISSVQPEFVAERAALRDYLRGDALMRRVPAREPGEETREEPSEKILAMIRRQPEITIQEMAEALGISTRAIEMQLAKLKESGKLQRIGPAKGGHWEVLEDTDE
jgi:ATP-dependent DNA helicase RecG